MRWKRTWCQVAGSLVLAWNPIASAAEPWTTGQAMPLQPMPPQQWMSPAATMGPRYGWWPQNAAPSGYLPTAYQQPQPGQTPATPAPAAGQPGQTPPTPPATPGQPGQTPPAQPPGQRQPGQQPAQTQQQQTQQQQNNQQQNDQQQNSQQQNSSSDSNSTAMAGAGASTVGSFFNGPVNGDFLGYTGSSLITFHNPGFVTVTRPVQVVTSGTVSGTLTYTVGLNSQTFTTPNFSFPFSNTVVTVNQATQAALNLTAVARLPLASAGAFKITDNESPRPEDRVFVNYNFFNNINSKANRGRVGFLNATLPDAALAAQQNLSGLVQNPQVVTPAMGADVVIPGQGTAQFVSFQADPGTALVSSAQVQGTGTATVTGTPNGFQVVGANANQVVLAGPVRFPHVTEQRATLGFEKASQDGNWSVGVRVPMFGLGNDLDINQDNINGQDIGDVSVILKYALINDPCTGNVFSGGVVITIPTGPDFPLANGQQLHPTLVQPYVGWIINCDRLYFQGFSSYVHASDSVVPDLLFNDVALGYVVSRSNYGPINGLVLTAEAHFNTPVDHRGAGREPVGAFESVILTSGFQFILGEKSTLAISYANPVTGPRPFDFEVLTQLNVRF